MAVAEVVKSETTISPLAKKLHLKPGYRGAVVNAPDGYAARLQPLPEGADLVEGTPSADTKELDFVLVFARHAADLEQFGPAAFGAVKPDSLVWMCYPKGGVRAGTDLNRDILWQQVSRFGLAGVALVAVDETWSAMRFRPADRVGK